ncbi:spore coat protein [Bacillus solitudinis]|uniref:spore coat protein n=1 Tax=Bacillus solitudinis TaxID=2014074 RepID=UPI001D0D5263|nr:spore coat protein [Bacillus solitudinis]
MNHQHTPQHLAWHETLEIHELVAFQSVGLMKLKKAYADIKDQALKELYVEAIEGLSKNIQELLVFYSVAPRDGLDDDYRNEDIPFYAGDLLAFFKTGVRNYAIAITETATPALRQVLTQHLMKVIDTHAKAYRYIYQRNLYPSYNLEELLENDVNLASKALNKSY